MKKFSFSPGKFTKKYTVNLKSLTMSSLVFSTFLFMLNFFFEKPGNIIVLVISCAVALAMTVKNGLKKLKDKNIFNLNLMISAAIIFLFCIGEYYQATCGAILNLLSDYIVKFIIKKPYGTENIYNDILKHEYHCYINREDMIVNSERIGPGDIVEIRTGELIPVDGVITAGSGTVDDFRITGNDDIITKHTNDRVLAGATLITGNIIVTANESVKLSSLGRSVEILKNSDKQTKKQTATMITLDILSAVVIVVFLISMLSTFLATNNFDILKFGIPLMIISSSFELFYDAINISYLSIINKAMRLGIIISSKEFLEKTFKIKTVLFSTIGVLSEKSPKIVSVFCANGIKADDLITYAAYSQHRNSSNIAETLNSCVKAKVRAYNIVSSSKLGKNGAITTITGNYEITTGTADDLMSVNIFTGEKSDDSILCVALNKAYIGYIKFESEVKTDVRSCVDDLKSLGVKEVVILSSQSESTTKDIMIKSGIDKYYNVSSQHDFTEILKKYKRHSVLYSFRMNNFDSENTINEIKFDGYNNFKDGDCITLAEDLSTPVNHLLLISNLKNLFIQNFSIFVLVEIFVAAASISHYDNVWQVILLIGIGKILMTFYSNKNIGKLQ